MNLILGDCLEKLKELETDAVDAVVCDPPAGISFMGKDWDADKGGKDKWIEWFASVFLETRRVLKPGGHALVWAIPRTSHWTATALENAGFEIRDCIYHLHGVGFPKSRNISKELEPVSCQCLKDVVKYHHEENLSDMSQRVGTKNKISKDPKQNLFEEVRGSVDTKKQSLSFEAPPEMQSVQDGFHAKEQNNTEQSEVLWPEMLRDMEKQKPKDKSSYEKDSKTREKGLDSEKRRVLSKKDVGRKESSLEGRGNIQEKQRELHRPEICTMSKGTSDNGEERRLHNGTQIDNGETPKESIIENRSSAPQRPQHKEQSNRESSIIPDQSSAQTCGRCGKPVIQEGLGSALKPAVECWWLCRNPLSEKTIAQNVLKHGTGGINIDDCRIKALDSQLAEKYDSVKKAPPRDNKVFGKDIRARSEGRIEPHSQGRWPANLVLSHSDGCVLLGTKKVEGYSINRFDDGAKPFGNGAGHAFTSEKQADETVEQWDCVSDCPIKTLDEQSGHLVGAGNKIGTVKKASSFFGEKRNRINNKYDTGGCASRFFYCAKPSKAERNEGCEEGNDHPTVKATELMRYLCRMITPPKGTVLDPFMGSGSTGLACHEEYFDFIGIEKEPEYFEIAKARIADATKQQRIF